MMVANGSEHRAATEHTHTAREQMRDTWGTPPRNADALDEWAATVAERRAEDDPRVIDAARALATTQGEQAALIDRHDRERIALLAQELGAERVRRDPIRARFIRPEREARNAHAQAAAARKEAEELRTLTPREAAVQIEAKRATAEQTRRLADERARRLRGTPDHTGAYAEPNRDGPSLGL